MSHAPDTVVRCRWSTPLRVIEGRTSPRGTSGIEDASSCHATSACGRTRSI